MMIVVMTAVGSMLMVCLMMMSVIMFASWSMLVMRVLGVCLMFRCLMLGLMIVVASWPMLVLVVLLMVVMLIVFVRSAEAKGNRVDPRPWEGDLRDEESTFGDFGQETESGFDHQLTIIIN